MSYISTEISTSFECPVCLNTIDDPCFSFDCGHYICHGCDTELFCRADDRCPTCRQPRLGESTDTLIEFEEFVQRRLNSLAQLQQTSQTIFFPVSTVIELQASNLIRNSLANGQDTYHGRIQSHIQAIQALLDCHAVSIDEFLDSMRTMR
jgi:hypothetical protein